MSVPRDLDTAGEAALRGRSPFLFVEDVAARYGYRSVRSIHELTRTNAIPHRRLPGSRRCLFVEAELVAWENGAELEVVELPRGGRVVKPRERRRG